MVKNLKSCNFTFRRKHFTRCCIKRSLRQRLRDEKKQKKLGCHPAQHKLASGLHKRACSCPELHGLTKWTFIYKFSLLVLEVWQNSLLSISWKHASHASIHALLIAIACFPDTLPYRSGRKNFFSDGSNVIQSSQTGEMGPQNLLPSYWLFQMEIGIHSHVCVKRGKQGG